MLDASLHLAPNAPWLLLVPCALALAALGVWAYGFARPPLAPALRRGLVLLRAGSLVVLLLLLAQPVLDRALPASGTRVVVLEDRSASMDLPESPGARSRLAAADAAARDVAAALRGRATVERRAFAAALWPDSARADEPRDGTALGDALAALGALPLERRPDGVVVISDGVINGGEDPVAAARALGVPVHTLLAGRALGADRAIAGVEASPTARVGEATPVRVRVLSSEPRGTPIPVRVLEDGRELARASVPAPGPGAEAVTTLRVTPSRPGLAVWSARVDSLAGDAAPQNDARGAALQVAPGKLGVLVITAGLNWDLAFLRRAWLGDSSLALETRVREKDRWRALERRADAPPAPADLRGRAVVVLDGVAGAELGPAFDAALAAFVRGGGGLLLLGGPAPGLPRFSRGALAPELVFSRGPGTEGEASPRPEPAAAEVLAWDDDPARGEQAWRNSAPLSAVQPLLATAGDRVWVRGDGVDTPLLFSRRAGRGPVLLVNGAGFWRWSLSGTDALAGDRGRRLWRNVVRWLSEPVQGEPLRVQPERWLTPRGEAVRLVATLQDANFRPVADAVLRGEARDAHGATRPLVFAPGEPGRFTATLTGLPPGRWQVDVRANGREGARAHTEFAVDTWSLEALRAEPDSATLVSVAAASHGRFGEAASAAAWARGLEPRALARRRSTSTRLWESPWLFALVVGALAAEWTLRRRRGLP